MAVAGPAPARRGRVLIIAADEREAAELALTFPVESAMIVATTSPWLKDGAFISSVLATALAGRTTPPAVLHEFLSQADRLLERSVR